MGKRKFRQIQRQMSSIQIDIKTFLPKSIKHRDRQIDPTVTNRLIDRHRHRQTKYSHRHKQVYPYVGKYKDR